MPFCKVPARPIKTRSIQRYPTSCIQTPKNLRDFLVKAKLKQSPPNNANLPKKVTRCNDGCCRTCKFIAHGTSSYTFHNTGEQRKTLQNLSCFSNNLVYLINCKCCIKMDPHPSLSIHWPNLPHIKRTLRRT